MAEAGAPASERDALASVGRVLAAVTGAGFELQPALDQIAAESAALCRADAGFVYLRDGDLFRFAAASGGTPEHWAYEREHPDTIDRKSIMGRVALSGTFVHVADVTVDPEYEAGAYRLGGVRTMLGVPIRTDEGLIGAVGLGRTRVEPFSDQEIEMVSIFADQAAIAIRLARLLRETHEALERETAVRQVVQSINRSTFDLDAVLQAVLDNAVRLTHADQGNITRQIDGEFRARVFSADAPPEFVELMSGVVFRQDRGSAMGRALLERGPVQIVDVLADPEYQLAEAQRIAGFRTILGIPLLQDGVPIGVLSIWRRHVQAFTASEISLLSTFADQVAIAVTLARLLTETHEALQRETAVGNVLQSISRSTFDLHQVLQTVIDSATRLSHADEGNITSKENGGFRMEAYTAGVPAEFRAIIDLLIFQPERGTITGRVLIEGGPVQIVDVLADAEYRHPDAQRASGMRTLLAVPLMREGTPIGVLTVWRLEVQAFSDAEIALLQTFADQAAIAIANVRLFETVERQRTELARFAPQVAGLLTSAEGEQLLAGHRREISAMFCDLRGFTAFAETAEPEELLSVLRSYHAAVGELSVAEGGTVEHFAGDGLMVFFNDPAPIPDHQLAAVRTACAVRDRFTELAAAWHKRGYELGMGIGIASGYATLGRIGFEGRYDYGAMGIVVNLAARLSDVAEAGQILISQRHYAAVEEAVAATERPPVSLKGFGRPIPVWAVESIRA